MRLIDADALMQTLGITDMNCEKCAWYSKAYRRCKRGGDFEDACVAIDDAPTIEERKTGEWTTEQVAELLANLFGDECACNFNGIDEWLPSACKYSETDCPEPKEKHGCWMQFLMQGGADMRGGQDG